MSDRVEIVDPKDREDLGLEPLYNPDGTPNCNNYPKREYKSVYDKAIRELEKN
jgi:hypothetical protein